MTHNLCETYPEPQHLSETGPWAGWFGRGVEKGLRESKELSKCLS